VLKGVCLLDLQLPTRHDWAVHETSYGKLVMEPFEPGFALTVGIAYRRALLSAIHGAAPTWVKIERVLHQFSHLPGVTEDKKSLNEIKKILGAMGLSLGMRLDPEELERLRAQYERAGEA